MQRRTLMTPALPRPIADYVKANAQLDVDGMLKPFAPDAVLLDIETSRGQRRAANPV
jgi:ketosteroid isomerase-like protein